ncbi:DET1 homolog [Ylistrum balloti]|uniref:DET1 homolog n=1 Tax=Ylistrum balloti TaxID=509963 RepID=UPI002905D605|nr:DET1 homolog [Ylistrum balloti]XP_060062549.1 DET1 homolog [Ylistrum balloti]XP_060062550.1 DET1 homolog [Ylistrum balloti]
MDIKHAMASCVGQGLKLHGQEIRQRKIPNQNIVQRFFYQQTHASLPGAQFNRARSLYTNVFPNFTVVNVEKPPCFLRKFSPDGRYFIAFSSDQTSIEIYSFQGSAAAEDILQNVKGDFMGTDQESLRVRAVLFDKFFKLRHVTHVANHGEHLNRECSLFTDDGNYVIVGSAMYIPDDPYPLFWEMYRNNESVSPNQRSPLENYSLLLIDLETGRLCDSRQFRCDKIFLSHNQGLYLYKDTLAVLSVQQQIIHIFQVHTKNACFVDVRSIGRFCYEDDGLYFHMGLDRVSGQPHRPFYDNTINSLKHRLMVFLYRRAINEGTLYALRKFYKYFDQFKALRMWKMQLLDENHLLIKYASEDVVTLKISDPNSQPSFFVVYNMVTTEVLTVCENISEDLLELFENFCDLFRNATLHDGAQFTCSASSNIYARQIQQRFKHTIINAKFGGHTEAVKRLLAQLPISSQSYSCSPYLDLALFSYDDKWVSQMERPKACGDYPIRFYARDSGLLKFKIYAGVMGRSPPPTARRLVAFTFHPSEPFAISVQRTNAEYVVNFHIRHSYCS